MNRTFWVGLAVCALAACNGQRLVGVEGSTGVLIAEDSAGDVPPTTSGTHGASTSGAGTTSGTTTGGTHGTTSGTTTTTTASSSTSGCGAGPDLSQANPWTMTSQYNLQQAGLPTLDSVFTDVDNALNTVNTLGVYQVPSWLLQTFNVLSSFDAFFQQLNVTSNLVLTPSGTGVYAANETWTDVVSTNGTGTTVDLSAGQITANEVNAYDVSVCMPTATFTHHSIGGNLAGLVTPLLDGLVSITSGGNYNTFSDLISFVFMDICSQFSGFEAIACNAALSTSLEQQIYTDINNLQVGLGSAAVQGTATVESGTLMDNGVWTGTDSAGTFDGTFTCNGS